MDSLNCPRWIFTAQMAALMIVAITLSHDSVRGAVIHGSVPNWNDDPTLLTKPIDVVANLNDSYQLVLIGNGANVKIKLGQYCNISDHPENLTSVCTNCTSLNVTSNRRPLFDSNGGFILFNITINDDFMNYFDGQSDIEVSFIHSGNEKNDTNLSATIHLINSEEPSNSPCDCFTTPPSTGTVQTTPPSTGTVQTTPPSTGTVQTTPLSTGTVQITNSSLGTFDPNTLNSSSPSVQLGNAWFSTWLVSICAGMTIILVHVCH